MVAANLGIKISEIGVLASRRKEKQVAAPYHCPGPAELA
jgi:hypothetical protein